MRRFTFSLTFCLFLLISAAFIFSTASTAKEDLVLQMLRLPAPPPPNPLMPARGERGEEFFSKRRVPPDDAPIRDLMDYWRRQSGSYQDLRYMPLPSQRVMDRLRAEISKDPKTVAEFLNIFSASPDGPDFVKRIYESWPENADAGDEKDSIATWLTWNDPSYARKLEKNATRAGERGEYVTNHDQLVTLARLDWDAARPTVDRLYADTSQPVARVMAMWALYSHSLQDNLLGDIDRYRDELKAVVEDKKATPGMRDLAFDALVKEKEWSGRDDWYYTLMEDETLANLVVNGSTYTGLTTLILKSHPDKYADKMIELVKSDNPVVRRAAARNLSVILDKERPDVVKALLPWLEDPKWAIDTNGSRDNLLRILQTVKVPESVPALIALLDEKETYYVDPNAANTVANAANMAANAVRYRSSQSQEAMETAANAIANAANAIAMAANTSDGSPYAMNTNAANRPKGQAVTHYPRRDPAIRALATQEDMRAVPALRRMLNISGKQEQEPIVRALLRCKGFTVTEQANGVETLARVSREQISKVLTEEGIDLGNPGRNFNSNIDVEEFRTATNSYARKLEEVMASPRALDFMLGSELVQMREPGDGLVREVVARSTLLEKREPDVAAEIRSLLVMWKGSAINSLLLKDLHDGKTDVNAVVKLLSLRKELQEKHSGEIGDAAKGGPIPAAITACLMESEDSYAAILSGENLEAKAALLGCSRLIRAKLPVKEVSKYLSSPDKRLAAAAESYLESEDSPEARGIVLSIHPNEAKITGATSAFWPENSVMAFDSGALFDSVSGRIPPADEMPMLSYLRMLRPESRDAEKPFREEVKKDADLMAIYAYEDNVIRIRKDKVTYEWGTDVSRYNERVLSKEEFSELTAFLASENVDDLPPFLDCSEYYCESSQLLMIGKNGGRRVFVRATRLPEFFANLQDEFKKLRQGPSKLKYRLEKEIPGLEILLADETREVQTVWSGSNEIRVVVGDAVKRRQIQQEIEKEVEEYEESGAASEEEIEYYGMEQKAEELRQKRRFDNFAWFNTEGGALTTPALQPPNIEFIPFKDSFAIGADETRWKSRTATVEFRTDDDGVHKISGGKMMLFKEGDYSSPVVTPNGKWLFVTKYTDEGNELVRINTATGREFPIKSDKLTVARAIAFVPTVNKMLASSFSDEEYEYAVGNSNMVWVDPETGMMQKATGEFKPLSQQTFRQLQPGPGVNEFWAAIPAENSTAVGIYNTRTFSMRTLLTVPKISFDSMEMWVDQPRDKVFFVYKGHLLSLPLTPRKPSA